jgi:hypothetical protein
MTQLLSGLASGVPGDTKPDIFNLQTDPLPIFPILLVDKRRDRGIRRRFALWRENIRDRHGVAIRRSVQEAPEQHVLGYPLPPTPFKTLVSQQRRPREESGPAWPSLLAGFTGGY